MAVKREPKPSMRSRIEDFPQIAQLEAAWHSVNGDWVPCGTNRQATQVTMPDITAGVRSTLHTHPNVNNMTPFEAYPSIDDLKVAHRNASKGRLIANHIAVLNLGCKVTGYTSFKLNRPLQARELEQMRALHRVKAVEMLVESKALKIRFKPMPGRRF